MRIVDVATKQLYRFNCPNCGSKLEAEVYELIDIGGKILRFFCPICQKDRYISWANIRKKTVYEDHKD